MPKQRRKQPPRRATVKRKAAVQPKRPKVVRAAKPAKSAKPAKPAAAARKAAAKPMRKTPARAPTRKTPAGRGRTKPVRSAATALAGPSTHDQAVDLFERGFQALQQRQFGRAAEWLGSVVNDFADEKELQERARVFLTICERQAGSRDAKPRSFGERVNAATITVNRGAFEEGLALFRKLEAEDPNNDHVQYMLSVTYTSLGEIQQALARLQQAVELAPENRFRAAQDPDLEPLRQDPGFAAIAEALPRRRRTATKKR